MFPGIFWTAYGLLLSLILCWSSVVCDGFAAFPIQFQFLRLPPMFLFNLKFQSAVQSGFTSRGPNNDLAIGWQFKNCEI